MTLMRAGQVAQRFGISRTTLWRWCRSGHFPPAAQLGPQTVAWRTSTVEAWLDERFATTEGS